jgi:RNA polymerase sigma-70 factor (ECF subfamily)
VSDADGPPADTDLLLRYCRHRDVEAFRGILDRHQTDLLRFAHSLLADSHAAQDAVQEAFCRLCREAERLLARQGVGSLGGWLCTVVRNACIDHLRRRGTAAVTALDDIHGDPQPTPAVAVAEQEAGE